MGKTKEGTGMKNTNQGNFGALTAIHASYSPPNMS
jgi:hypothetical protein